MKKRMFYRVFPACMALALGLAACSEPNKPPPAEESGSQSVPVVTRSGSEGEPENAAVPQTEPEEESLARLRDSMTDSGQIVGAVAYLGFREQEETTPLPDWLRGNCPGLTAQMPFLLDIPAERVLGAGWGDLYCIVPRDENTSLAVNHVTWESLGNGVWPVADGVHYRETGAQPVLVFVNFGQWCDEPDTEILLVTKDGVTVNWCPLTDEYGVPVVPTGKDSLPMLMDFGIGDEVTGLDYPEGWEHSGAWMPPGDCWPLPPAEGGLADTNWTCEPWYIELGWGDCAPDYSGSVELYHQAEEGQVYELVYSGVWRMENDCLHLELSDSEGVSVSGNFPVLIDPAGEHLHVWQDGETAVCPPFFGEGMTSADLTRTYG